MKHLTYSTEQYNFHQLISAALGCENLEQIHNSSDFKYTEKFERANDQSTHYHQLYYTLARTETFQELYTEFIKDIVKPEFGTEVVYQTIPTFRLHFPGNIAVGEFHRDRNYRDESWAKRVKEYNFFLPFTSAYGTNTIWVESEEGKEDFSPMLCEYGQTVMWDGSNLLHGNKTNIETTTRVSVDFRVMSKDSYEPSTHGSINTKTRFEIGGYYSLI